MCPYLPDYHAGRVTVSLYARKLKNDSTEADVSWQESVKVVEYLITLCCVSVLFVLTPSLLCVSAVCINPKSAVFQCCVY